MLPKSKEKMFFFAGSKKRKLLGFLHLPPSEAGKPGIIYCHPFADEMNLSYRVTINTARLMAAQGFPVLRFHMSGCGDSEGELNEVTIDDWKIDIECAINCLKSMLQTNQYGLWGLRLGAGLALVNEMKFQAASFLMLWQPVISFSTYIKQFLRRKAILQIIENNSNRASLSEVISFLQKNSVINAMGYPINNKLYQSFMADEQSPIDFVPQCYTLLLSISKLDRPHTAIINYYKNGHKDNNRTKYDHVVTDTFWDQYWNTESKAVDSVTLEFLNDIVYDN